ncbi:MAG: hypothetical protein K9N49_09760, partial [Candidatus Marinimicrobia bacterium]|nr:hypothetical protein [Candidatus Neomarinimicrobiota bacterium]
MSKESERGPGAAPPGEPGVARRLAAVLRGGARLVDLGGQMVRPVRALRAVEALPPLCAARAHAIRESLRWGEAYIFFLAPDLIAWMVAVVHEGVLRGGVQ